jgi:hypothetical protein
LHEQVRLVPAGVGLAAVPFTGSSWDPGHGPRLGSRIMACSAAGAAGPAIAEGASWFGGIRSRVGERHGERYGSLILVLGRDCAQRTRADALAVFKTIP